MKLILEGQPLSTQHCYKATTANGYNRTYMTQKCVDLKTMWQWAARIQWKEPPIKSDIAVVLHLYHGDKRRRDIDNYCKLLFDCLTGIVYEDDSQITQLTIHKQYDKDKPRVVVEVLQYESE